MKWTVLMVFAVTLISCSSLKKASVTPTRSLPPIPVSQINIPVRLYMKPLLARMDSMTSKEFTSDNWPNYFQSGCDFRYKYRFIRSPFTFSVINNRVNISFQGNYQIAGSKTVCAFDRQVSPWVSGSCGFGEPLRIVDININSLLEISPQYQVRTTTKVDKLEPRDKCVVSLLQTDITKEVMDSIKASIDSYTIGFDKLVQAFNNYEMLRDWRRNGNKVVPVSNYGYMNLKPSTLRIGKLNYIKDTLMFSVGFNGYPHFASDSMAVITQRYLPTFSNADNNGGVSTYLDAVYEYSFLSKLLNDSLRNKPFEVDGRTFLIRNINLQGTDDNKILIDVSFDGNKRGTFHLSGTPQLDSARQVLFMPDVSFSVDSRDMLINIAKGLLRKQIMRKLKDQSVLDIAELIKRHKTSIEARLNQPVNEWIETKGSLEELRVVGILAHKNAIQLQLYIKGNIMVIGSPPPGKLGF